MTLVVTGTKRVRHLPVMKYSDGCLAGTTQVRARLVNMIITAHRTRMITVAVVKKIDVRFRNLRFEKF